MKSLALIIFTIFLCNFAFPQSSGEFKYFINPYKYTNDVVEVKIKEQFIQHPNLIIPFPDKELEVLPYLTVTYKEGRKLSKFSSNYITFTRYEYDNEQLIMKEIKNDTSISFQRKFDKENRAIEDITYNLSNKKIYDAKSKYFYDKENLNLIETFHDDSLVYTQHYTYTEDTVTKLVMDMDSIVISKNIKVFQDENNMLETSYDENGNVRSIFKHVWFRDAKGNIIKSYRINQKANVGSVREYIIVYN